MTTQELERLEAAAHAQCGKDLGTTIALTPRTLLELCRLARIGAEHEASAEKAS